MNYPPPGNRLLATLAQRDQDLLRPFLEVVDLDARRGGLHRAAMAGLGATLAGSPSGNGAGNGRCHGIRRGGRHLLVFSQLVLCLQLPFAVYPLVRLTNSPALMGKFANKPVTAIIAWSPTAILIGLNAVLVADLF